jgi:hypothetical protein
MHSILAGAVLPELQPQDSVTVLNSRSLRTDMFPEMKGDGIVRNTNAVNQLFTDELLLFSKLTDMDRSHMYGNNTIQGDDQFDALLPLSESFARDVANMPHNARIRLLTGIANDLTIVRIQESVSLDGVQSQRTSYQVDLTWQGKQYRKLYHQEDTRVPSGNYYMPVIATWPNKEDPTGGWKHFYLYYRYDNFACWENLQLRVLEENSTYTAKHARNPHGKSTENPNGIASDNVVESKRFPQFVSVCVDDEHMGLLLPKPEGGAATIAAKGSRTIGIDFGTTATVVSRIFRTIVRIASR